MEDRRDTWKVTADPVIEYVERYIAKIDDEDGISYDELYNHFTSVVEQSGEKAILKPAFQRKIMTLTGATRGRMREHGVQKSYFKGITLRSKLKDEGQASLDNSGDTPDSGSAFVTLN